MKDSNCILIAELGATNARMALTMEGTTLIESKEYLLTDFSSVDQLFEAYFEEIKQKASRGIIGVAAPVLGEKIRFTNNNIMFNQRTLKDKIFSKGLKVINDLELHAYAVEELGGFYVMLNTSLEGTESSNSGDVTVSNDFRKITLIRDPESGASAATSNTLRATRAVNVAGITGSYVVDETITQTTTGAVGKVVEWDATNSILYYIQTRHVDEGIDTSGNQTAFSGTNLITGAGGATATPTTSSSTINNVVFVSGYSVPEIDHDSGDILYIENRAPITRAADQTENIKLVIEF